MVSSISYHVKRVTTAVSSMKRISHPRQSEPHNVVVKTPDYDCLILTLPENHLKVLWLQSRIFSVLLLTLLLPIVICDNGLCSSEHWCVSASSGDPCSVYSSQTTPVGQSCSCVPYQHNFSVCLNNVSLSIIF